MHSIGIIGSGDISAAYLRVAQELRLFQVAAVSDLDQERARARAQEFGVRACTPDELLALPELSAVVNLTPPAAHASVSEAVLRAGKHLYSEKPLATSRAAGRALLAEATSRGLRLGCAPDTFLGAGLQSARELLDAGAIGTPLAATAFMLSSGPEAWHPNPHFFFQPGGGPLFDMGPYYLTALVNLLGPVRAVTGQAVSAQAERVAGHRTRLGERIPVNTPTHVTGLLDFEAGASATLITSFDVQASELPRIELYGSEGTLSLPDPNTFGGPLRLRRAGAKDWEEVKLRRPFQKNARGIGLADLLWGLDTGEAPRASGELAYHVLDVMGSVLESAEQGHRLELTSRVERPAPLPEQPAWLAADLA